MEIARAAAGPRLEVKGGMIVLRRFAYVSVVAAMIGCAADPPGSTAQTIVVPTALAATFTAPTCTVVAGPAVQITGELSFGGLDARMIFRNNQKGTHEHTDDFTTSTVVIPADESISIPTPSLVEPPGSAPLIFIQFFDSAGNPVTTEIFLGTCDAAGFPAKAAVSVATTVTLTVSATGCQNNPGPTITVDGAVEFAGLHAVITVQASDGSNAGAVTATADVVALAAGETHSIPKQ